MSFNNPFSNSCSTSDDGNFPCFEEMDKGDSSAFTDDLPSTRLRSQSVKFKNSLNSQVDSFADFPALPVRVDSHTFEISLGARVNSIAGESSATDITNTCSILQVEESQNCEEFAGPFFDDENEGHPSISTTDPLLLDPPTPHWDSGRSSTAAFLAVKRAKGKEAALNKVPVNTGSPASGPPERPSYRDLNFEASTTTDIGIGQLSQHNFTKDAYEDGDKAAFQRTASCGTKISLDPPKRDTLVRDRSLQSRALMEQLINVSKDALKKPPPKRTLPASTTAPSQRALVLASSSPRPKSTRLLVRDTLLSCPSPSRSRRKMGAALLSPRSKSKTSRRSPSPVSSPRSSDQQSPTEEKSGSDRDRASSSRSRRRPKSDSNPRRSRTPSSKRLSSKAGVDSPSRPRRVSPSPPASSRPSPRSERRSSSTIGDGESPPPRRPSRKLAFDVECPSPGKARRRSSIGVDPPSRPPRQLAVDIECPSPRARSRRSSIDADSPSRRPRKLAMATDLELPPPPTRSRRSSSGESPSRRQPRKSSSGDLEILSARPRNTPTHIDRRANGGDNENMRSRRPNLRRASPSPRAEPNEENARHASAAPTRNKEQERPTTHQHSEKESRTSSEEECGLDTVEQASGRQQPPRERQDLEKVDVGETQGDSASNEHPPSLAPILTPPTTRVRKSRVLCEIPGAAAASRRRRRKSPSTSFDDSSPRTQSGTTAVVSTSLPPSSTTSTALRSQKRRVSAHLLHTSSEERAKFIEKGRREASCTRRAQIAIDA